MITVMNSNNKPMKEVEKCLDSQLWNACAGGMVQMPLVSSKVFYFPQGHSEHANEKVEFGNVARIPPLILCSVSGIKFLADTETDEVFAKIRLIPSINNDYDFDDDDDGYLGLNKSDSQEKTASFAKTLTQSDANNGGGFSVPRYCAETIFPRLDYSAEPPVQTILAKDVHGERWKFRHIYRGTPRRHLLTTGWSNFVNQKKLVAGDSIVFLRADNGDLCVGIRRAKRGISGGGEAESLSGWNALGGNCASPFVGYSAFLREDETKSVRNGSANGGLRGKVGRVSSASVVEAATMAASGQPFEVVYYPRASAPEFCVKASAVRAAMRIQWCPGMRFKMPFETEDSSRISWFMGSISSVQVDDPIRWPSSPWRLLQVAWDEPDLLQNVKQVSPWLVELVSNMPAIHLCPFSPPRKKLRAPQPLEMPPFPSSLLRPNNPFCLASNNIPASLQGARHAHYGLTSADHNFNKLHQGSFFQPLPKVSTDDNDNLSCLLTMGVSAQDSKKNNEVKAPAFFLFGKPIHAEEQISQNTSDGNQEKTLYCSDGSGSGSGVVQNCPPENLSDDGSPWYQKSEFELETGHCKVFMESDGVGRTLDLTALGSYEELYRILANMFNVEGPEMLSSVLYRDVLGAVKHTEDEPFSVFSKTAKRLTILLDSGSDNMGR